MGATLRMVLSLVLLLGCARALRVDVVALSQTSHVLSVLGVAQELQRRGHNVSFISFEENRAHAVGVPFVSVGALPHPHSHYDYTKVV